MGRSKNLAERYHPVCRYASGFYRGLAVALRRLHIPGLPEALEGIADNFNALGQFADEAMEVDMPPELLGLRDRIAGATGDINSRLFMSAITRRVPILNVIETCAEAAELREEIPRLERTVRRVGRWVRAPFANMQRLNGVIHGVVGEAVQLVAQLQHAPSDAELEAFLLQSVQDIAACVTEQFLLNEAPTGSEPHGRTLSDATASRERGQRASTAADQMVEEHRRRRAAARAMEETNIQSTLDTLSRTRDAAEFERAATEGASRIDRFEEAYDRHYAAIQTEETQRRQARQQGPAPYIADDDTIVIHHGEGSGGSAEQATGGTRSSEQEGSEASYAQRVRSTVASAGSAVLDGVLAVVRAAINKFVEEAVRELTRWTATGFEGELQVGGAVTAAVVAAYNEVWAQAVTPLVQRQIIDRLVALIARRYGALPGEAARAISAVCLEQFGDALRDWLYREHLQGYVTELGTQAQTEFEAVVGFLRGDEAPEPELEFVPDPR